ncbi:DUF992 domain-containing protein [Kaistia granuli]|jgi:hypothetical protein|uniref:DUF992 domain-containing protein n=1 Tax=Kaistia granuli TaxID=363259 RepID=UPI00037F66AC|nr:DUF992 domain-containing protein [Kaistia granuli]
MSRLPNIIIAASAVIVMSASTVVPASAATRTGTLVCTVAPGMGFLIGSSKRLDCQFNSKTGRERYTGRINKLGLDIGITTGGKIAWAVLEPSRRHGDLGGTYVGASAEATAGVGLGANVLVGGGNGGISLQPLSVSGQKGLDIAAGIGSITLTRVAGT